VHPLALVGSLLVHAAVGVWLIVAIPDFGERLAPVSGIEVDIVLEDADSLPRIPAAAAPLPERAPTRLADPSPPAQTPSPEPAGSPSPPPADAARAEPRPATPTPAPPQPEAAERQTAAGAEPEPTAPPTERRESATATTPPARSRPSAPAAAEPIETEPAPRPDAPRETAPAEAPAADDAPTAATAVGAVAEPPRRRPRLPEPASGDEAPPDEPAPQTVAEADTGAPQPQADTRRDEAEERDPVDALLQSVEQLARRVEREEVREGSGDADVTTATGRLAELRAQQLGRLIYEQIVGCWNPPAGLEGLREVGAVEVRAEFRSDGEVVSAEVEDEQRLATDRVFRSVAESARRAVYNCAPLEDMPTDLYPQWRLVILEFRPDQIAAGG